MGVPGPTRVSISLRAAVSKRSSFWGNCRCRRLFYHLQRARKGSRWGLGLEMPMAVRFSIPRRHWGDSIQIKDDFLSAIQRLLSFNRLVSAAEGMSSEAGAWFI